MKKFRSILLFTLIGFLLSCSQSGNDPAGIVAEEGVPVHLNKQEFLQKVFDYEKNRDWKYEGDLPAIIDFYADWCKPCKMVAPIMDELAREYKGKVRIYKIDTDKEKELAGAFQINSIPAVLFIPVKGQPQMSVGALPKSEYVKVIDNLLLPSLGQTRGSNTTL